MQVINIAKAQGRSDFTKESDQQSSLAIEKQRKARLLRNKDMAEMKRDTVLI